MSAGHADLVRRLEKLERENRRLKRWGAALLGGTALLVLTSAAASALCKTVWAERFVLQDSSGRDRMVMDAYTQGAPTITLRDERGKSVAQLTYGSREGTTLRLFDADGQARGRLGIAPDGRAFTDVPGSRGDEQEPEPEKDAGVAMAGR